jgi:hypothetical protein
MVWQKKERRKKDDFWVLLTRALALGGWLLFILALIVSYYAAPEIEYGLIRFHGEEVRKTWQPQLTLYLYIILWLTGLISLVAIIINQFRTRRATDGNSFNFALLLLTTIAWAIYIYFDVRY